MCTHDDVQTELQLCRRGCVVEACGVDARGDTLCTANQH